MRVTQNMLNNTMMRNLNNSWERMGRLQEMLSSGKKISKPSHDPVIAVRGMLYRTTILENEQFRSNTDEAVSFLQETESAVYEGVNVLSRIKELVTQAANDTLTSDERKKIKEEIVQLRDHLGTVANMTFSGRYLFNGTDTLNPPYDENSKKFTGTNSADIQLEISTGINVPINVKGTELFGTSPSGVFDDLQKIIDNIENEKGNEITAYIGDVQKHIDKFLEVQASVGARVNRIQFVQNRLDTQNQGTRDIMSKGEDADMAKVIMDLQNEENVHRAALASGSRIIQPTLLDFLR
jgi:flagellar hook-associated protein 3 FlgL